MTRLDFSSILDLEKTMLALLPHRIVSSNNLDLPIVVVDSGSIVVVGSSGLVDSSTKVIMVLFTKAWKCHL